MKAAASIRHPWLCALLALATCASGFELRPDGYHVKPSEEIQPAIEAAARNPTNKMVKVHAGTYRPASKRQALIWFNRFHDGVQLEGVGEVILSGSNSNLADRTHPGFPSVVNHVVYFGDGVSARTTLSKVSITGANDFFMTNQVEEIEPNATLPKGLFFYGDGGGIKIFGRSYPVVREVVVFDNYASPCAGGVSVEHDGHGPGTAPQPAQFYDCIFRNNRSPVNGAGFDILPGSSAILSNCLFVGNVGNLGRNYVDQRSLPDFTNAAVLCVFQDARAVVQNSTLVGNRNGLHDLWTNSVYQNCIFWSNSLPGGYYTGERYEVRVDNAAQFTNCFIAGKVIDPNRVLRYGRNQMQPADPQFDSHFNPRAEAYRGVGYRSRK